MVDENKLLTMLNSAINEHFTLDDLNKPFANLNYHEVHRLFCKEVLEANRNGTAELDHIDENDLCDNLLRYYSVYDLGDGKYKTNLDTLLVEFGYANTDKTADEWEDDEAKWKADATKCSVWIRFAIQDRDTPVTLYTVSKDRDYFESERLSDIAMFLSYGPDDSVRLVEASAMLTSDELDALSEDNCDLDKSSNKGFQILQGLANDSEPITTGGSDWPDIVRYACEVEDMDPDNEDEFDEMEDRLTNDEDYMMDMINDYVEANY